MNEWLTRYKSAGPRPSPTPASAAAIVDRLTFGGNIIENTISALRVLNEHPDTIFTVLTGEGRFFSAGADVKGIASDDVRKSNN